MRNQKLSTNTYSIFNHYLPPRNHPLPNLSKRHTLYIHTCGSHSLIRLRIQIYILHITYFAICPGSEYYTRGLVSHGLGDQCLSPIWSASACLFSLDDLAAQVPIWSQGCHSKSIAVAIDHASNQLCCHCISS